MTKRIGVLVVLGVAAAALASVFAFSGGSGKAGAADHLDGPLVAQDGRVDINDVFVFHPSADKGKKGDPGQDLSRTVFVMTVNPGAGVISGTEFDGRATYTFAIDTDGDARRDAKLRVRFTDTKHDGRQYVSVAYARPGHWMPLAEGWTGDHISSKSGVNLFAGVTDDPFFMDLDNFNNGATFCDAKGGLPVSNFFKGLNVSAIVVEIPTSLLGKDLDIGVWGSTYVPKQGQIDRMGRPGITTVFIPKNPFEDEPDQKDAFNAGKPNNDQADFRAEIVDSLTLLHSLNDATDDPSDDAAKVEGLADILLPDILTVDLSQPTGFLNGRNLEDDVIDAVLPLITEGALTTDCVDNDSNFTSTFPYLADANTAPEPAKK